MNMDMKINLNGFSGSELDPMIEMVIRAIVKRVAHRAVDECMDMVRELMAQRQEMVHPCNNLLGQLVRARTYSGRRRPGLWCMAWREMCVGIRAL